MRTVLTIILLVISITFTGCSRKDNLAQLLKLDEALQNGQNEQVISDASKYLEKYPESFKGWNIVGWAYLDEDNLEEAEKCFDKAISINNKADNAYVGKGVLYRKTGELDKARECYLQSISITEENPEAYSSLAVIEMMEDNNEKAVEYGEKAWKLRKDSATIAANLSVAYHYTGNLEKRDDYYEHASDLGYDKLETLKEIFDGKATIK